MLRKTLGLPPAHFHVTLTPNGSINEEPNADRTIHSLLPGQLSDRAPDFLDHLIFTLLLFSDYSAAQTQCFELILAQPDSFRGFLRLADAALQNFQYKLAMLAYAQAFNLATPDSDGKMRSYCVKRIEKCSHHSEWGQVFQGFEIEQVPERVASLLTRAWSETLKEALDDLVLAPSLCLESREQLCIPISTTPVLKFYKLPRFFRWIVPFHLAAMSTPKKMEDIDALSAMGFRTVLTLTEEEPLPRSWFSAKPISNIFLPIPNYHPPSIEQMDIIMQLVEDETKLPLLVHCGGGKGRAGTVIACYLAAYGFSKPRPNQVHPELSANEVIAALRTLRPGSLETPQQEAFVSKWCSTIWKRQSIYPLDRPSEPPPCKLVIDGELEPDANLFMLAGLPGSGKSWLSQSLIKRNQKGWACISQDETGSRASCETEIGHNPQARVLLDRCNTSDTDRKRWLELASNWVLNPVCVWFDYDRELCVSRAQMRVGHPTLPPGNRVRRAVEQMQRIFVRPSLKEGFKAVVIIRSFEAAKEFVAMLSPKIGIHKFPRTAHLLDLGAATSDDIILPSSSTLSTYSGQVIITEKVDGANMGFSLSADRSQIVVQNRSHYVSSSSHEQFKKLAHWLDVHRNELYQLLDRDKYFPERYILFGEWLYATHSIPYTHLPDRFMAFDLYDRSLDAFLDRRTLEGLLGQTTIGTVPVIYRGEMPTEDKLKDMVQSLSMFYDGRVEGVYVKWESGGRVVKRGKVVRADFIAGNEHWSKKNLQVNGIANI
ncbi:ATP dependent DNA ligase [Rhodocollybia butyracea]|uniref:ATP dependent DNA ligase n=1 Tax=Rhodocollybia butyracea TaxID=206335 RepID=A0A9P5UBL4_9AGAR|nr:ATP dependent DNA ligase [Rhodocollybia butyracea]